VEVIKNGQGCIEKFLRQKKFLEIQLSELIHKPNQIIDKLIDFLNISSTSEQKQKALEFIHPDLLHT
jgi:fructose-specific phosphotransferase system component IIB